jgi:hypothetical protein
MPGGAKAKPKEKFLLFAKLKNSKAAKEAEQRAKDQARVQAEREAVEMAGKKAKEAENAAQEAEQQKKVARHAKKERERGRGLAQPLLEKERVRKVELEEEARARAREEAERANLEQEKQEQAARKIKRRKERERVAREADGEAARLAKEQCKLVMEQKAMATEEERTRSVDHEERSLRKVREGLNRMAELRTREAQRRHEENANNEREEKARAEENAMQHQESELKGVQVSRGGSGGASKQYHHQLQPSLPRYTHPGRLNPTPGSLYDYLIPVESRPAHCHAYVLYEDKYCVVCYDAKPKAEHHLLLLPRRGSAGYGGGGGGGGGSAGSGITTEHQQPTLPSNATTPGRLTAADLPALKLLHGRAVWCVRQLLLHEAEDAQETRKDEEKEGEEGVDKRERSEQNCRAYAIGYHAQPSMEPLHLHLVSLDFNSECFKRKSHYDQYLSPGKFIEAMQVEHTLTLAAAGSEGVTNVGSSDEVSLRSPMCTRGSASNINSVNSMAVLVSLASPSSSSSSATTSTSTSTTSNLGCPWCRHPHRTFASLKKHLSQCTASRPKCISTRYHFSAEAASEILNGRSGGTAGVEGGTGGVGERAEMETLIEQRDDLQEGNAEWGSAQYCTYNCVETLSEPESIAGGNIIMPVPRCSGGATSAHAVEVIGNNASPSMSLQLSIQAEKVVAPSVAQTPESDQSLSLHLTVSNSFLVSSSLGSASRQIPLVREGNDKSGSSAGASARSADMSPLQSRAPSTRTPPKGASFMYS